ncbi:MAG: acyl--CoA ligase [Acidimicrobiaceae bacterium]|nr:acyl--CoA ligase [Acidimicrobiaceae bacterium]MXW76981.1 acyl--CoA ligase [Acidimicrobiaceae bacterium]MYA74295.1 acyl--CoA ligase [Acidimicrobiaceae bacterium]MYC41657.1 acyl--CoA ligase [Acidimicrobiaceae bacterium]MYD05644.1 acyl--CoA ligase [Acidimicrobiaceae bacterium]
MGRQASAECAINNPVIETLKQTWAELTAKGSPFAWSTQEVRGIPMRVFDTAPPNMRFVWELSAQFADRPYIVFEDETITYGEAHAMVRSLAHYLVNEHGVGAGDRVAIAMRNYPEWALAYWATIVVGASAVGVNAWWTASELEYALNDSRPKVLIADDERLERVLEVLPAVRAEAPMHIISVRSERELPDDASRWPDHVIISGAPDELPPAEIAPDDDICIFYTSGTTGFPKGAQLTHRGSVHNVLHLAFANAAAAAATAKIAAAESGAAGGDDSGAPGQDDEPAQAVIMVPTPLFHVTANNCVLHPATISGGKMVMMYRWDTARAIELIERESVNMFTGVPTMSREMLAHPDWRTRDTSSLAALGGGGAAIQPDLVEKIDNAPGDVKPATGYGLTETSGVITAVSNAFFSARPTSAGLVMPTFEYKVIDADGDEVPTGERGELCVKGPAVVKGYINRPEATAEAIVDGWFRTGDIVYIDSDEFVHIVDRAKDMVLRGGENVYCAEVEAAIYEHPDVAEAAVFGVPDDRLGEAVGAAIYLADDATMDESELAAHLAPLIAKFKQPTHVWFIDEPIPQNANGKFVKRQLREQLLAGQ